MQRQRLDSHTVRYADNFTCHGYLFRLMVTIRCPWWLLGRASGGWQGLAIADTATGTLAVVMSLADAAGVPANDPNGAMEALRGCVSRRMEHGRAVAPLARRLHVAGTHASGLTREEAARLVSAIMHAAEVFDLHMFAHRR